MTRPARIILDGFSPELERAFDEKLLEETSDVRIVKENYRASDYGNDAGEAMRVRNARARELRKEGFTVTCKKWDFTDLARDVNYTLEATKEATT